MDLMTAIAGIPGVGGFLPYILATVAVAAAVAPFLPPPLGDSGRGYKALYAVINKLAINVGNAKNMTKPLLLMLASGLALSMAACTPAGIQTAQQDVAIARNVAQSALNTYPIIKGMAKIAALADPALAPAIDAAIAAIEPNIAKAQIILDVAGTSAPVLIGLAGTLTQQVQALTIKAAPAIKVVGK